MTKTVLIDGNSLVYRAFFALPTTLTLESGQVTNAVYGFTSMLIRLLIDERPDTVAVAFDSRGATWRHGHFEGYKAHREATPDDLISQFPLVKEVLTALRIPIYELPGHEADDILATLAVKAETKGEEVLVVTADKDAFQLISDGGIKVMTTRKGITDIVIYDREKVRERYGIEPEQIPDFLGLKGDASDNIPGVPGIGDKTAAKLLQEFGTVENIYARIEEVSGDKVRKTLIDNQSDAEMSKKLAVLTKDLDLELDTELSKLGDWDEQEVRKVFHRFEFRTLLERFESKLAGSERKMPVLQVEIAPAVDLDAILTRIKTARAFGAEPVFDEAGAGEARGTALAFAGAQGFNAFIIETPLVAVLREAKIRALLQKDTGPCVCVHDAKSKLADFQAPLFDPMLAAYLLSPADVGYEPRHLCHRYLEIDLYLESGPENSAAILAAAALALREPLSAALASEGLTDVYENIELPLVGVLARMEATGVGLDREKLAELAKTIDADLESTAKRIFESAQEEFNINSPQQVAAILFEKLNLKPVGRTKSKAAFTTDAAALAKLADKHEIVPLILDFRELAKLKSTYVDALPKMVDAKTGRLHTSFNQTITTTGRLSSSNPNLQNIPMRSELGRRIREAFVPAHRDERLLAADYSQIELRLLAHVSDDDTLKSAFRDGVDIHAATAAEVLGLALEDIGSAQRRNAKAINFGIVYGMSAFGLAQQLGISAEEAKQYINLYFSRYPRVREYLDRSISNAHRDGFVTTLTGRKRYLPELRSPNHNLRSFAERAAVNAPLQGSAADIIKIAMIDIDRWLQKSGLQTRMVLQVHDELIFEVPPLEEGIVESEVRTRMENAYQLSVPLEVNLAFGRNWGEAK